MKRRLWIVGVLVLGVYLLATSIVPVKETEIAVVMQFGKPVRTIREAGLAVKPPAPIQTRMILDKRLQMLIMEPAEFVTRDRRNLVVAAFAAWRISDPGAFLESVRDRETAQIRLRDLVNASIGAAIGNFPLNDIFAVGDPAQGVGRIFQGVTDQANAMALREFGIEVIAVRPSRFGFPRQNLRAIYQRMISEQERVAKQYRAEGKEAAANIRSGTERETRELLARAYRESQIVKGKGDAEAAKIYADAFNADADYYKLTRTLDAYEKILGEETTLILSSDSPIFEYLLTPPQPVAAP